MAELKEGSKCMPKRMYRTAGRRKTEGSQTVGTGKYEEPAGAGMSFLGETCITFCDSVEAPSSFVCLLLETKMRVPVQYLSSMFFVLAKIRDKFY